MLLVQVLVLELSQFGLSVLERLVEGGELCSDPVPFALKVLDALLSQSDVSKDPVLRAWVVDEIANCEAECLGKREQLVVGDWPSGGLDLGDHRLMPGSPRRRRESLGHLQLRQTLVRAPLPHPSTEGPIRLVSQDIRHGIQRYLLGSVASTLISLYRYPQSGRPWASKPSEGRIIMDEILTTQQVAEVANLPVGTLRWFRHTGEGPKSFKLGRSVRYRKSDIEAWIEEHYAKGHAGV